MSTYATLGLGYWASTSSLTPPAFDPSDLPSQVFWYRSDQRVDDGTSVSSWTDLYTNPIGVDMAFSGLGAEPTINTAALHGRDTFSFDTDTIGITTSPESAPIVDPGQAFCLSYVFKCQALAMGTYCSLITLSGNDPTTSIKLFYTNLSGLPVFYLQIGSGTVAVIGAGMFTPSIYHYAILNYNGAGDYSNVANWSLVINNVAQTITSLISAGGTSAANYVGDDSGGGASPPFEWAELIFLDSNITGSTLTSLEGYYNMRYGL